MHPATYLSKMLNGRVRVIKDSRGQNATKNELLVSYRSGGGCLAKVVYYEAILHLWVSSCKRRGNISEQIEAASQLPVWKWSLVPRHGKFESGKQFYVFLNFQPNFLSKHQTFLVVEGKSGGFEKCHNFHEFKFKDGCPPLLNLVEKSCLFMP